MFDWKTFFIEKIFNRKFFFIATFSVPNLLPLVPHKRIADNGHEIMASSVSKQVADCYGEGVDSHNNSEYATNMQP